MDVEFGVNLTPLQRFHKDLPRSDGRGVAGSCKMRSLAVELSLDVRVGPRPTVEGIQTVKTQIFIGQ